MSRENPLEPIDASLARLERALADALGDATEREGVARAMDEVRDRSRRLAETLAALLDLLGGEVSRSLDGTRETLEQLVASLQGAIPEADRQVLAAAAARAGRLLELIRRSAAPSSGRVRRPPSASGRLWELPPAPASAAAPAPASDDAPDAPNGPRVVVCDGDPLIRTMLARLLGTRGYTVIPTANVEEALSAAAERRPGAMILDPMQPGGQPLPDLARLASLRELPVLVCSTSQPSDAAAAGIEPAEWLLKPVGTEALIAALEEAIASGGARPTRRVLLVEDNDNLARLLTYIIEKVGAEAVRARTGLKAIQMSRRALPDLVVLDVGLPEFDGFAVVEWMKQYEKTRHLPLLVYTGRDLEEADQARLRLGRTEYLRKGHASTEEVERLVKSLLAEADGGNGGGA